LKQKDLIMLEKKVNTTPVDYAVLNQLYKYFETRFVPQTELSAEQAFWSQNSMNSPEPNLSSRPTKVEVLKELPKVSMVNTSLKKLKHHLAGFDVVVKEKTTPTAITEGSDNSVSNQSAPSFDQLFELNELKAQSQEKDTVIKKLKERIKSLSGKMNEDKIKKDLEEIETINIELDHRVSKLIAENEHLKQTYKQLYDSIKPARIRSKEQCDDLINQVNLKSVEISDLNASLQEKVLVITDLKDDLRKLKGKALVDNDVTKHPSDPEMLKIDVEPITPKLLNKKTAHSAYIKHTQEEATVLRDLVEHVKSKYPLDHSLESACRYAKLIQELLTHISKTCPSVNNTDGKLVAVTPKNKDKRVRFTKPVTSSGNTITKTTSTSNLVSNKPMLSSTGVKPSTSASGSQPSGNTKKDKIQQTPSSTQKNKVEAHPRKVKSSLKNKDCVVESKGTAHVQHSKLNANSELKCVKCNGCMLSANHDLCVLDFINNVNAHNKSKSVRKSSKRKVVQIVLWYLDSGCSKHMTGDHSQLTNFVNKFLGTVKFENDHVAKILGYGDYQIGNVTITRVYYVEGLGHKLFSIGYFSHETSVARSPQQNGVVERRNRTLIEAARTMLIYAKALLLLWAEAVATASAPATISSGLVPNPPPSTLCVPPSRNDWDILFQPLFDELLTPPPSVDYPDPEVIAPIDEVVAPVLAISTGSPSSTTVDQDAPSPSNSQTTPETQHPIIPNDIEEDNHDIEVAHMGNDPYFGIPIPEIPSDQSSSSDSIHTILHEQALFCYYDAFLTAVVPKMYKDALTQSHWIKAMQEEINELELLKVWELIPRPDKVMVITLNWIYKVKLDELGVF
ncbi:retrovirus-related pol polyprotein from transposon TNT 1-94, partial [Tanacetum coccineum]